MSEKEESIEELQARLAKIRARKQPSVEEEKAAERARLQREIADELALEAAESEHGPLGETLGYVKTSKGIIIVRKPKPGAARAFMDTDKINSKVVDRFVRPIVVHPDREAYDALADEYPAVPMKLANVALTLAGFDLEAATGKS